VVIVSDFPKDEKGKQIRGFNRLKLEDPERFKDICARAGRRAQKLGHVKTRWTKAQCRYWGRVGGRKLWRQRRGAKVGD
jgi:hypothetical protein